ncbi:unnamed protein product [Cylicostephanus goldi]|uniref:Uncharacterized protein n=1 Tax=Cylicostephanus goldi TaxID=71465 RepID=A0A3P7N8S3_CYLGO|nr:unnamed protein product [Cylicostephanus goldi]
MAGVSGALPPVDVDMLLRRALVFSKLFTKSWGHPNTFRELMKHKAEVMSQRRAEEVWKSLKMNMIIEKVS